MQADTQQAASSALALALQQRNRERPALMSVAVRAEDAAVKGEAGGAAAAAAAADADAAQEGERVAIEVTLWRADAVAAVVEVDGRLEITRADPAAGLLFGVSHRALVKKDFRRCVGALVRGPSAVAHTLGTFDRRNGAWGQAAGWC